MKFSSSSSSLPHPTTCFSDLKKNSLSSLRQDLEILAELTTYGVFMQIAKKRFERLLVPPSVTPIQVVPVLASVPLFILAGISFTLYKFTGNLFFASSGAYTFSTVCIAMILSSCSEIILNCLLLNDQQRNKKKYVEKSYVG